MKIRLVLLGKMRNAECRALFEEYLRRLRAYATIEVQELREAGGAALRKSRLEGAQLLLLDPAGRQFRSEEFAKWLEQQRERGARELVFVCGDAEGFPEAMRGAAHALISLSSLTLPHDLARVVLAEQLYRAFTILAGHPYHK